MSFQFVEPWHAFLPTEPGHVIGFAGSGGKTTLMIEVARIIHAGDVPVVITTTTRCEPLPGMLVRDADDTSWTEAPPPMFFLRDGTDDDGKWRGLEPDVVDALARRLDDRIVLVEVDGAAKMPLKLHREDEPRWPRGVSLAILVMGAQAVGARADGVVHRFGRMPQPAIPDVKAHTNWLWEHQKQLLLGRGGYLGRVPDDVPTVLALSGLDEQPDSVGLFGFLGDVMTDPRLPLVMLCSLVDGQRHVRTAAVGGFEDRGGR